MKSTNRATLRVTRRVTKDERNSVLSFCRFMYYVTPDSLLPLRAIQGAVPSMNGAPRSQQQYALHLRVAIEMGILESVAGAKDTYRRIGRKRSSYSWLVDFEELKDKILHALEHREWID